MARASALSVAKRNAIRDIHDGAPARAVGNRTLESLVVTGYVDGMRDPRLTAKGQREYDLIMESGDGPEALKQRFRW